MKHNVRIKQLHSGRWHVVSYHNTLAIARVEARRLAEACYVVAVFAGSTMVERTAPPP